MKNYPSFGRDDGKIDLDQSSIHQLPTDPTTFSEGYNPYI